MQNHFDLHVADVIHIYMIMPRHSHKYALFYQLLDSNLFTHRRILMLLREATSETYVPRVYSHHINLVGGSMKVRRTYTNKQEPCNQRDKGVVNPFMPLAKVRSDRDNKIR